MFINFGGRATVCSEHLLVFINRVVHRDVKPGNFLFSRKATKGYLVDFNLAIDLHQKYGSTVSKVHHDASFCLVHPLLSESLPSRKIGKLSSSKGLEAVKREAGNCSKMLLFKSLKKKTEEVKEHKDLNMHSMTKSQGADGSGITSTKEGSSIRVPSAERLREPSPCQDRKELLNLVHEAMHGPDHEVASTPTSKRKRVAAPPAKSDKKFVYLTPMLLHSVGVSVAGAGLLKTKEEGKKRREELVLVRRVSGLWRNIKEIAKLRGSEDLWGVAKSHDRESSFPPDNAGFELL